MYVCHSDADTKIVKLSLNFSKTGPVTIFADDSDILCLLLHHCKSVKSIHKIYLTSMTKKHGCQRECYEIDDDDAVQENISLTTLFSQTRLQVVKQHQLYTILERLQFSESLKPKIYAIQQIFFMTMINRLMRLEIHQFVSFSCFIPQRQIYKKYENKSTKKW